MGALLVLLIATAGYPAQAASRVELDSLKSRIVQLERQIDTLKGLQTELEGLKAQLEALEDAKVSQAEAPSAEHPPRARLAPTLADRIEALEECIGVGVRR